MVLGYLIGRIKIGIFSLGVAGTLFAGIAMSALNTKLSLPPIIYILGLILFIYTTGISLGPTFFAGLKTTGLRDNILALIVIIFGATSVVGATLLLDFDGKLATGMYTGTFTATPALAGVLDALKGTSAVPVVGYSIAYPFSIIASLLLIGVMRRVWKIDQKHGAGTDESINPHTVHYLRKAPVTASEIAAKSHANIVISRLLSGGSLILPKNDTLIRHGDYATVVGTPHDYELAAEWMGKKSSHVHLEAEQQKLHERRVFISNRKLAGRKLGKLKLREKYNIVVTRVRRGDTDMVVHDDFIIELGDRLRMVGAHADIDRAANYLGDSYQSVAHTDILSPAIGISLGVLLGALAIPLPGGRELSLGAAGGTIIVALVLGALRRTGPLVWQIPYATNLAVRQLGLMIFLAGVGSTAGSAFSKALSDPKSYLLMGVSFIIAAATVSIMLFVGYKMLKIPYSRLSGMVAAMNTQPATLAYVNDLDKTNDADVGYASVYPMALIAKILIAQVLLIMLS